MRAELPKCHLEIIVPVHKRQLSSLVNKPNVWKCRLCHVSNVIPGLGPWFFIIMHRSVNISASYLAFHACQMRVAFIRSA